MAATYWPYGTKFHFRSHLVIHNIVIGLFKTGSDFAESDPANIKFDNWKNLEKGDLTTAIFHLIFKNFSKL